MRILRSRRLALACIALAFVALAAPTNQCSQPSGPAAPPGAPSGPPPAAPPPEAPPPVPTPSGPQSTPVPVPAPTAGPASVFTASVRPILKKRCDPCHNPGGKMYDKLPFDDASVVASHRPGVMKRLKDPDERGLVEAWFDGAEASEANGKASNAKPPAG